MTSRNLSAAVHPAAPAALLPGSAQIQSSAQILTFEPGLYAVELTGAGPGSAQGLTMPCARLDPLASGPGRIVRASLAEGGFLNAHESAMFLRVLDGPAELLLTTYRSGRAPLPELRIRAIAGLTALDRVGRPPVAAGTAPPVAAVASTAPYHLIVHAEALGDMRVAGDGWAGGSDHSRAVEGFCIELGPALAGLGMEYQAILGPQWQTPWFGAGEYCGSRGMALPLIGFRLRLTGEAASAYRCRYWGRFAGGSEVGPLSEGEACEASGHVLAGMRVDLAPNPG